MSKEAEVQRFVSTVRTVKGREKQEEVNESSSWFDAMSHSAVDTPLPLLYLSPWPFVQCGPAHPRTCR